MATKWSKALGGGEWPIFFERERLTPQFGRFCIQPLQPGSAASLERTFEKALLETLPGAAVAGARIQLKSAAGRDAAREAMISSQLSATLIELRIASAACFPLYAKARLMGPRTLQSDDLKFNAAVQILTPMRPLVTLDPTEFLELDLVVHWGRGSATAELATDIELPRGWLRLPRRHSPVLRTSLSSMVLAAGPHAGSEQLIAEITTDGSLAPEDALRRAAQHVRRAPNHMAS